MKIVLLKKGNPLRFLGLFFFVCVSILPDISAKDAIYTFYMRIIKLI